MSLNLHTIILPRIGENLIAIVNCSCRGEESDAIQKITKAVTKWVKETENGQIAWKASSEDFNIGDLHGVISFPTCEDAKSLYPYLQEEGVFNLRIEIVSSHDYAHNYTYDTVLVDE